MTYSASSLSGFRAAPPFSVATGVSHRLTAQHPAAQQGVAQDEMSGFDPSALVKGIRRRTGLAQAVSGFAMSIPAIGAMCLDRKSVG